MSDQDVKWFTFYSEDSEDYIGDICDTREEAIEQGRDPECEELEPGESFYVCKGIRVTENEIADWIVGRVEMAVKFQEMESDLELYGDDPLVEPKEDDYAALSVIITSWLKERKLVRELYRWEPSERIEP